MATRAEDVLDMIDDFSLNIPVGTLSGIRKMEKVVETALREKPIEDEYTMVYSVDFSENKSTIKENSFSIHDAFINSIFKLDLDGENMHDINKAIRNSILLDRLNYSPLRPSVYKKRYHIPITETIRGCELEEDEDVCYIIFEAKKGRYVLPSFNGYNAPIISFSSFRNTEVKKITKKIYNALSDKELNPLVKRLDI